MWPSELIKLTISKILCRAGVSPLQTAFAVFQNEVTRDKILQLCRLIPMEVLERGLNKYALRGHVDLDSLYV